MSKSLSEWLALPENAKRRQEADEKNKIARGFIACEECGRDTKEQHILGCCQSGKCNIENMCDRCGSFNKDEQCFCSMRHHVAVENAEWIVLICEAFIVE
jgi:hypothetical protein